MHVWTIHSHISFRLHWWPHYSLAPKHTRMTLQVSGIHLSFRALASSEQTIPANKHCPLVCGVSPLSPAHQSPTEVDSLTVCERTSLLKWNIPITTVHIPVHRSQALRSAVQYCMEGKSSVEDLPYFILQQEATHFLQDSKTPAKARAFSLVKSSSKFKAFSAMVRILKSLQCHTLEVKEWTDSTFCLQKILLTF